MPAVGTTHHVDRIQSAISSNGAAKSALIASWQRSACFHKLDPARRNPPERLTESEFRRAREEVEPLIQVVQSSLDRTLLFGWGSGLLCLARRQKRRMTDQIKRELRRRAAVEPVIGHLKAEHRMGRNHLAGRTGDAINAVLAAAGYNFRLLIAWLAAFLCLVLANRTSAFHEDYRTKYA